MSDSSGKIAPTAHYTAYAWHVLGLPHADLFATPLGKRLYAAYAVLDLPAKLRGQGGKLLRTLRNRHALIDRELERLAPDVVVELGAGLSRRGPTYAAERALSYLEIDLPEMVAYKQKLLEERGTEALKASIRGRYRAISADIMADDFAQLLARELSQAQRPLVIAEGVIGYFQRPLQRKLLRAIHAALAGKGAFLADLRVKGTGQESSIRALRLGILVATRGRGAADSFRSKDDIRALFAETGFSNVTELPAIEEDVMSGVWRAEP